jgi:hypothetical protein
MYRLFPAICLLFLLFFLPAETLSAQGKYYKYDENLRLGVAYSTFSGFPDAPFLISLEYNRLFIDPAFVAIHHSYSNGEGESLASLDLGMYYGILKNMDHDFRLGGFLSARYAPLESLSAGEDDFEIIPGLMVAALYEFSISKRWAAGARLFGQFYEDQRKVLGGGALLSWRF